MDPVVASYLFLHRLPLSPDSEHDHNHDHDMSQTPQSRPCSTRPSSLPAGESPKYPSFSRPLPNARSQANRPATPPRPREISVTKIIQPPQGMRTFWCDDNDNEDNHDPSYPQTPGDATTVDCTLNLLPPRRPACSPSATSPSAPSHDFHSDYRNSPGPSEDVPYQSYFLTSHSELQGALSRQQNPIHGRSHSTPAPAADDEELQSRIFRSNQALMETSLRANDALTGKLDWTSTWMSA